LSGTPKTCQCGNPLRSGKVKCLACELHDQQSWWGKIGLIVAVLVPTILTIAVMLLTGGKVKPKA